MSRGAYATAPRGRSAATLDKLDSSRFAQMRTESGSAYYYNTMIGRKPSDQRLHMALSREQGSQFMRGGSENDDCERSKTRKLHFKQLNHQVQNNINDLREFVQDEVQQPKDDYVVIEQKELTLEAKQVSTLQQERTTIHLVGEESIHSSQDRGGPGIREGAHTVFSLHNTTPQTTLAHDKSKVGDETQTTKKMPSTQVSVIGETDLNERKIVDIRISEKEETELSRETVQNLVHSTELKQEKQRNGIKVILSSMTRNSQGPHSGGEKKKDELQNSSFFRAGRKNSDYMQLMHGTSCQQKNKQVFQRRKASTHFPITSQPKRAETKIHPHSRQTLIKNATSNSSAQASTFESLRQVYYHDDKSEENQVQVMSATEMTGRGLSMFYQTYGRRIHHHIVEERSNKNRRDSQDSTMSLIIPEEKAEQETRTRFATHKQSIPKQVDIKSSGWTVTVKKAPMIGRPGVNLIKDGSEDSIMSLSKGSHEREELKRLLTVEADKKSQKKIICVDTQYNSLQPSEEDINGDIQVAIKHNLLCSSCGQKGDIPPHAINQHALCRRCLATSYSSRRAQSQMQLRGNMKAVPFLPATTPLRIKPVNIGPDKELPIVTGQDGIAVNYRSIGNRPIIFIARDEEIRSQVVPVKQMRLGVHRPENTDEIDNTETLKKLMKHNNRDVQAQLKQKLHQRQLVLTEKLARSKYAPVHIVTNNNKRSINDDLNEALPNESLVEKSPDRVSAADESGEQQYDLVDVQNKAFKSFSKIFAKDQETTNSTEGDDLGPAQKSRLEPFLKGKQGEDRNPFKIIPHVQKSLLDYMALIKERMRIGERKSCDHCFSKKETELNQRAAELHEQYNRARVYEDQVVNSFYTLDGKFNLASDTDIKLLIKDFEAKAEKNQHNKEYDMQQYFIQEHQIDLKGNCRIEFKPSDYQSVELRQHRPHNQYQPHAYEVQPRGKSNQGARRGSAMLRGGQGSANPMPRLAQTPYYPESGTEFDMMLENRFPEDKYFVKNAQQHRRSYIKKNINNDYSPTLRSDKNWKHRTTSEQSIEQRKGFVSDLLRTSSISTTTKVNPALDALRRSRPFPKWATSFGEGGEQDNSDAEHRSQITEAIGTEWFVNANVQSPMALLDQALRIQQKSSRFSQADGSKANFYGTNVTERLDSIEKANIFSTGESRAATQQLLQRNEKGQQKYNAKNTWKSPFQGHCLQQDLTKKSLAFNKQKMGYSVQMHRRERSASSLEKASTGAYSVKILRLEKDPKHPQIAGVTGKMTQWSNASTTEKSSIEPQTMQALGARDQKRVSQDQLTSIGQNDSVLQQIVQVERDFLELNNGEVRSNLGSGGRIDSGVQRSMLSIPHDGNEYKLIQSGTGTKVRFDGDAETSEQKKWATTQSQPQIMSPVKLLYPQQLPPTGVLQHGSEIVSMNMLSQEVFMNAESGAMLGEVLEGGEIVVHYESSDSNPLQVTKKPIQVIEARLKHRRTSSGQTHQTESAEDNNNQKGVPIKIPIQGPAQQSPEREIEVVDQNSDLNSTFKSGDFGGSQTRMLSAFQPFIRVENEQK